MKKFILLPCLVFSLFVTAQPSTEVYLFDLDGDTANFSISNPINISNNEGYDNQPSFWPDGKSVLYARTMDGQTEIARYFIDTKETKIISKTTQGSEYSPTIMPDRRISSVRLDTTGLQLLYAYDLIGNVEVLVPEKVIGYHAWVGDMNIAAFVLGEPATLQIIDTKTNEAQTVYSKIGRSIHKVPNHNWFSFVDKSKDVWAVKAMDPTNNTVIYLTNTLEGSEDYAWTPQGSMVMGQGTKLFHWERNWSEFADLSEYGLGKISRVAVSRDGSKLVVVVDK
ncbi:MAG: hypothetical protein ABJG78_01340 [Cyclobacteriaceae bacterium]